MTTIAALTLALFAATFIVAVGFAIGMLIGSLTIPTRGVLDWSEAAARKTRVYLSRLESNR